MIFSIFELEKTISQLAFTQSYLFTRKKARQLAQAA